MQAPSCSCLASPVLSAAPFTARPCSVRPDWLPAGHHGWSGVCRTTPIFAGDLLPDSALIVVSFYRCTCLILSGQALAAQKDLQVQVVHPEDRSSQYKAHLCSSCAWLYLLLTPQSQPCCLHTSQQQLQALKPASTSRMVWPCLTGLLPHFQWHRAKLGRHVSCLGTHLQQPA